MDSVKTALRIYESVVSAGEAGVSELARQLGEPKSTVQRSLVTLYEAGWLKPTTDGARRKWSATSKLFALSHLPDIAALRRAAAEPMQALNASTRESIHLIIREGDEVVLIDRLDSPQTLRTVRPIGGRARLHVVSTGKAIMARWRPEEVQRYLEHGLERWTDNSIVDAELLKADLDRIRERGFAVSEGELDMQVRAVGAVIVDAHDRPIGALSISCPASRLPDDLVPEYGRVVLEAVRDASRRLIETELGEPTP